MSLITIANLTSKATAEGHRKKPAARVESKPPAKHIAGTEEATAERAMGAPPYAHNFAAVPLYPGKQPFVQPKLTVNEPGDKYEQEADSLADKVMRMAEPGLASQAAISRVDGSVQRKCDVCGEEHDSDEQEEPDLIQKKCAKCAGESELLQKKGDGNSNPGTSHSVSQTLQSAGRPLDGNTRSFMEPRFGHDFGNVQIHNDSLAKQSAKEINARAYTHKNHIVFGDGQYQPGSEAGKRLLAHELTHVVQQGAVAAGNYIQPMRLSSDNNNMVMRTPLFNSTISICERVLVSRTFHISKGGAKIDFQIQEPDLKVPGCQNHPFHVTLTKAKEWYRPDTEISDCVAQTGDSTSLKIGGLSEGDYYFTVSRSFDNPNCCIEGAVEVSDEAVENSSGCEVIKQQTTVEIIHDILDAAGFIPVLGAIPDGINALIYTAEGDWTNVGISALAMIPEFGDAASLVIKGEKKLIKIEAKGALKLEKEAVARSLKQAKNAEKAIVKDVEKGAVKETEKATVKETEKKLTKEEAEQAAKEALKKRVEECLAIHAAYKAFGACKKCLGTDTAVERAEKIACLTAVIAGRGEYLRKDCDDVLPGSIARGSAVAKRGHQIQLDQLLITAAKCATLPIRT